MGTSKTIKLSILAIIFLGTSLAAYSAKTQRYSPARDTDLRSALIPVAGYRLTKQIQLQEDVTTFLDLDDYTYASYSNEDATIDLYVGYYYSAAKISAAHSPLSCFPGQGWQITQPIQGQTTIGNDTIHYSEITAELDGRKELIFFWYQAYDNTTPHVYLNKINTIKNKLLKKQQEHAFIRISAPIPLSTGQETTREFMIEFLQAFYPQLIEYIKQQPTEGMGTLSLQPNP